MRSPAHALRLLGAAFFFLSVPSAATSGTFAPSAPAPRAAAEPLDPAARSPRAGLPPTCADVTPHATVPSEDHHVRAYARAPHDHTLYAITTRGELLRYAPGAAHAAARVTLDFDPLVLAVADGPGALVLVAGRGRDAITVHDPQSLAIVRRYALAGGGTVVSALDIPGRARFALGFSDRSEIWEIAYAPDAPPVLLGLVHDYRSNEAVPLPGRLTPRPFKVAGPTRVLLPGARPRELLRVDHAGHIGVIDLEVRREIERPAFAPIAAVVLAAMRSDDSAHGWLLAAPGMRNVVRLSAGAWTIEALTMLPGAAQALAASTGSSQVYALQTIGSGPEVLRIDARTGETTAVKRDAIARSPAGLVAAEGGRCVVVTDADGRRILSLPAAPGTPAGTAAPLPTR